MPTTSSLATHHCVPCEGGTKPLTPTEFAVYIPQVPEWTILEEKKLTREWECKNFADAVKRVSAIAAIAEAEGHHPDIFLHDYKKLTITLTTHAIGGLSINDFVMAVKIDDMMKA